MGDDAVHALMLETGLSLEDAHDLLHEPKPLRCPICNRKCRDRNGAIQHVKAVHTTPRLRDRVAEAITLLKGSRS